MSAGERVQVIVPDWFDDQDDPMPLNANLRPLRYDELETTIVTEEVLAFPGYTGYRFSVRTAKAVFQPDQWACLNNDFRLVEDVD